LEGKGSSGAQEGGLRVDRENKKSQNIFVNLIDAIPDKEFNFKSVLKWTIPGLFFFTHFHLVFFKKWANLGLFFIYFFCLFKNTLKFLQQIPAKKSIQYRVSGFELITFGA